MWEIRRQDTGEVLLKGDGDRPGQYDLANRDLSGADLACPEARFNRGVLKGSALPGARFTGLRLRYLVAPDTDLAGANLTGAACAYLDLRRANLLEAKLEGLAAGVEAVDSRNRWLGFVAWLVLQVLLQWFVKSVSFRLSLTAGSLFMLAILIILTYRDVRARKARRQLGLGEDVHDYDALADMGIIHLESANLSGASLVDARLPYLQAQHACFREANLRNASLRSANLVHADLSGADIRGTDFREACMVDANLSGAVYDERTRFPADFMPDRHGTMVKR